MPREVLEQAIENSVCFGPYDAESKLVGFGRAITDLATYAYLTDIVIETASRGRGLGRWLVQCMTSHPDSGKLRRIALVTLNAHGLYETLGFGSDTGPLTYMETRNSATR